MNKHNLKVGQKLYLHYNPTKKGQLTEVEVLTVGRKWAELGDASYRYVNHRVDLETLQLESGRATVWLSQEHFDSAQKLDDAWKDFTHIVTGLTWRRPPHVTIELIAEARAKLGI